MNTDEFIQHFLQTYLTPTIRYAVREELKKQIQHQKAEEPSDEMLSAKEAAAFIGDALPTFYGRTSRGEIATYGSGKRIFIKKSELLAWKQKHRTLSTEQIQEEVARKMKR
jgi:hypothetical protein